MITLAPALRAAAPLSSHAPSAAFPHPHGCHSPFAFGSNSGNPFLRSFHSVDVGRSRAARMVQKLIDAVGTEEWTPAEAGMTSRVVGVRAAKTESRKERIPADARMTTRGVGALLPTAAVAFRLMPAAPTP